uniref:GRF-type domain-containing protein n=1 Tax=Daucus carota subsp. sativus TaxID=79200 RepID=A0A164VN21_DAUCS
MSISSKSSSSSSPSVQNSMRSYGSNRNNSGFDCGYSHLKCKCDILAPLQEAWREGTMDPGRRFFGCSNYKDPTKKCNFFLWADPPYSDRARDIIHQLRFKMRVKDAELQKMKEELSFVERKMLVLNEEYGVVRKKLDEAATMKIQKAHLRTKKGWWGAQRWGAHRWGAHSTLAMSSFEQILSSPLAINSKTSDIAYDLFPYVTIHKNGTTKRHSGKPVMLAPENLNGVRTKDVVVSSHPKVIARIFLPESLTPGEKIPVLLYFHRGGFCIESALSACYTPYTSSIASACKVIVVSVDYRLAPEHQIPACYDDSWEALKWVVSHASGSGPDPGLNQHANADLLARLGCGKVLVCTAENDIMRTRGWSYYEALKKSEWKGDVEIVETMGMGHVFHLFNPNCEQARSLIKCYLLQPSSMSISSKSSSSSSPSVQNSMRSYGSNRNNSGFDCGYSHLKCKCDILAPLQEAWREGTMDPGRRFFGCSNYKDPTKKCNFFLWADPPYSDRARDIIHQLRFKMRVKDAELQKMKEELSFVERKMLVLNEEYGVVRKKLDEAATMKIQKAHLRTKKGWWGAQRWGAHRWGAHSTLAMSSFEQILSSPLAINSKTSDIAYDLFPYVTIHKNGTTKRHSGKPVMLAPENLNGVRTKDVVVSSHPKVIARIFLPESLTPGEKIPVLLYFHRGGFCIESALSACYTPYTSSIASACKVIVVSVDYRLAPEHQIPACYDDSWEALKWVVSHASGSGPDPGLNQHANADLLARLGCGKVLVCTAENDIMRTRGWSYYEALKKSEWKGDVEIVETMGMGHVFHLFNPNCEQARSLIKWLASFIKDDKINSVL